MIRTFDRLLGLNGSGLVLGLDCAMIGETRRGAGFGLKPGWGRDLGLGGATVDALMRWFRLGLG